MKNKNIKLANEYAIKAMNVMKKLYGGSSNELLEIYNYWFNFFVENGNVEYWYEKGFKKYENYNKKIK